MQQVRCPNCAEMMDIEVEYSDFGWIREYPHHVECPKCQTLSRVHLLSEDEMLDPESTSPLQLEPLTDLAFTPIDENS
jgi:hypothetical protein